MPHDQLLLPKYIFIITLSHKLSITMEVQPTNQHLLQDLYQLCHGRRVHLNWVIVNVTKTTNYTLFDLSVETADSKNKVNLQVSNVS